MMTQLYSVTTKKSVFHVSASSITNAIEKANAYLYEVSVIGVEPEQIIEIKHVGKLLV